MDDNHSTGSDQRASQPLTSTVISSAETMESIVQDSEDFLKEDSYLKRRAVTL